uniref:V-type proton ATPase subunit G n=1 Tax=Strongyloides stercoralis TaxID=6248 RepID=A0A0K0DT40_STRER
MEKVCKDMEDLLEEAKRTQEKLQELKTRKIAITTQLDKEYENYVCQQIIKESSEKLTRNIEDAVLVKQMFSQKLVSQQKAMDTILREVNNIISGINESHTNF